MHRLCKLGLQVDKEHLQIRYALPMDLRYFFDLRSPILDAFFLTASVLRPSCLAILDVGLVGKSFFSRLTSLAGHIPFGAFLFFADFFLFAILSILSLNYISSNLSLFFKT
jgi:hypothetical protein